ncbi:MAG: hypothetical protein ACI37T_06085 [Candidatus Gastranaerophilaceae bacterium]
MYISTSKIFYNHILSILLFSLCLSVSVLYYKNFSFSNDDYPLELRKNDNDSKILAFISSFLIFLSGVYNYIVFHQQNYNELIILSVLSILGYFVYVVIYYYIDKFFIYSLEKHHRENEIFIKAIQKQEINEKFKKQRKIGFIIFVLFCVVGLYFKFFSNIPNQIHDFWDYYCILGFVYFLIWIKLLKKGLEK